MNSNCEGLRALRVVADYITKTYPWRDMPTHSTQLRAEKSSSKDEETLDGVCAGLTDACTSDNAETEAHIVWQSTEGINMQNICGETLLMTSCHDGNVDAVKDLLNYDGIDVNIQDNKGETCLMHAVISGDVDVLSVLLNHNGIDIHIKDNTGQTALRHCIVGGTVGMLSVFLGSMDLSVFDDNIVCLMCDLFGEDVLHYVSLVGLVLESKGDPLLNVAVHEVHILRYIKKLQVLQNNIKNWKNVCEVVKYVLLHIPVDDNAIFKYCLTVGTRDLISMILNVGSIDTDNSDLTNYCYSIVSSINPKLVTVLVYYNMIKLKRLSPVESEAIVESVIRYNSPELSEATANLVHDLKLNDALTTALIFQSISANIVITTLKDVMQSYTNTIDRAGNSGLHLLCKYASHGKVAEVLKVTGIFSTRINNFGQTCFMLSLMNDDKKVAELFFDEYSEYIMVNDSDKLYTSTLMYACECNNVKIVKSLVAHPKIKLSARDYDERTALMYACTRGNDFPLSRIIETSSRPTLPTRNIMTGLLNTSNSEAALILLDSPNIDITAVSSEGASALQYACYGGDTDIVSRLIHEGIDVNMRSNDGISVLMIASSLSHVDIVKQLLAAGAAVNDKDKRGLTALHYACLASDSGIVGLLLDKQADSNTTDDNGRTPLYIACESGNMEIITMLLNARGNPSVGDHKCRMPLHIACEADSNEMVKLLLNAGCNANGSDAGHRTRTPLHIACETANTGIITMLLNARAHINVVDEHGRTPLHTVCLQGNVELATLLLNAKPDRTTVDVNRKTPMFDKCAATLRLHEHTETDIADDNERTPLSESCITGHTEIANLLLEAGANTNTYDFNGRRPLLEACLNRHTEIATLLVKAGADTNITNRSGRTPLYIACMDSNVELVKLLLNAGASTTITGDDRRTPLHVVCKTGHTKIATLLLTPRILIIKQLLQTMGWISGRKDELNEQADTNKTDGYTTSHITTTALGHVVDNTPPVTQQCGMDMSTCTVSASYMAERFPDMPERSTSTVSTRSGTDMSELSATNMTDSNGRTPLFEACLFGHFDIVNLLLNAHADSDVHDDKGWTPLHFGCLGGNVAIVTLLLNAKVDPNKGAWLGVTPLHIACITCNVMIVNLLMDVGANPNVTNDGMTPLHMVCVAGSMNIAPQFYDSINVRDYSKPETSHIRICTKGKADIVDILLRGKANVNATNKNGRTALMMTVIQCDTHAILIQLVNTAGIAVNVTNHDGHSALSLACKYGNTEAVALLLKHKADISLTIQGRSLREVATDAGHTQIADMLKQKGKSCIIV